MTTQHTPGPWHYGVRKDRSIWLSLGDPKVAGFPHYQGDLVGTEANARLIAAAPELLEALNSMLTHMGMDEDDWNKPTFDKARAAIAKATGAA